MHLRQQCDTERYGQCVIHSENRKFQVQQRNRGTRFLSHSPPRRLHADIHIAQVGQNRPTAVLQHQVQIQINLSDGSCLPKVVQTVSCLPDSSIVNVENGLCVLENLIQIFGLVYRHPIVIKSDEQIGIFEFFLFQEILKPYRLS